MSAVCYPYSSTTEYGPDYLLGALAKTPEKRAASVALCNLLSQIGKFTPTQIPEP